MKRFSVVPQATALVLDGISRVRTHARLTLSQLFFLEVLMHLSRHCVIPRLGPPLAMVLKFENDRAAR
jgi:hypothetical protein